MIFPEAVQDHQYDVHFSYPRMALGSLKLGTPLF
jgi:hypothetical protein